MLLSRPGVRRFVLLFLLLSCPSCFFLPFLSLCFHSPPRHTYASIVLSLVLRGSCRNLSFLSTYAFFLVVAFLTSSRIIYIMLHFRFLKDVLSFRSFLFPGLACVAVVSYPGNSLALLLVMILRYTLFFCFFWAFSAHSL